MSGCLVIPEQMLRRLVDGLKADIAAVQAAGAADPRVEVENEYMAAGLAWAVNALEVELLGEGGSD